MGRPLHPTSADKGTYGRVQPFLMPYLCIVPAASPPERYTNISSLGREQKKIL